MVPREKTDFTSATTLLMVAFCYWLLLSPTAVSAESGSAEAQQGYIVPHPAVTGKLLRIM